MENLSTDTLRDHWRIFALIEWLGTQTMLRSLRYKHSDREHYTFYEHNDLFLCFFICQESNLGATSDSSSSVNSLRCRGGEDLH